jgi:hypothetical protein
VELPYCKVYVNTGDPIEEQNLIEFHLLYEGQLLGSNNESRPEEKHAIRRIFHPQLRQLWKVKQSFRYLANRFFTESIDKPEVSKAWLEFSSTPHSNQEIEEYKINAGLAAIGKMWTKAGFDLVPLVVPQLSPRCSIEILLLRPEEDRSIFRRGDIDGQVRTLLDALRIPDHTGETGGAEPSEDEKPLFCLLQDDRLVSEVKVTSDQLLMLPEQRGNLNAHQEAIARLNLILADSTDKWPLEEQDRKALEVARAILKIRGDVKPNDAFVVIHVRLSHREPRTFDNYLG